MTDYFVPHTGELTLSTGAKVIVVKGIRPLSDDVAGDLAADRYGIKPLHEMTPDERVEHKLPPAEPDVVEALAAPAKADPAPAPAPAAPKLVSAPAVSGAVA